MLKTINDITIRQFAVFDETGDTSIFKPKWNIFPIKWFRIDKVIISISEAINSGANKVYIVERDRLIMLNKILMLEALYYALYNIMILKPQNDQWNVTKAIESDNLAYYIQKTLEVSNIKVIEPDDCKKLRAETDRLLNKYLERYGNKGDISKDKVPFIDFAYSVFSIMEMEYNPNMTLYEFIKLSKLADKKAKKLEQIKAKNGRN